MKFLYTPFSVDYASYLCMCAKSLQSCLIFCNPMDCCHQAPLSMGILESRILEWIAMPSSSRSSKPRMSYLIGMFLFRAGAGCAKIDLSCNLGWDFRSYGIMNPSATITWAINWSCLHIKDTIQILDTKAWVSISDWKYFAYWCQESNATWE